MQGRQAGGIGVPTPLPSGPISDRYAYVTDDHAVLVDGLERGIKLTLTTPRGVTGTDLTWALGSALEDARHRLANMADPTLPWSESPAWK